MNTSLLTSDGFPRADIDVPQSEATASLSWTSENEATDDEA